MIGGLIHSPNYRWIHLKIYIFFWRFALLIWLEEYFDTGSNLEARTQTLESFACGNNAGFKLRWNPPTRDADLVKGYEVKWREQSISYDRRSGSEFVGLDTEFTTPCSLKLQPGRLYWTTIRTIVELRHPKDVIFVEETSKFIILGLFL